MNPPSLQTCVLFRPATLMDYFPQPEEHLREENQPRVAGQASTISKHDNHRESDVAHKHMEQDEKRDGNSTMSQRDTCYPLSSVCIW